MKFIVCDHVSLSVICTSRNQSLRLSRMTHSLYYKNMFHKNDETENCDFKSILRINLRLRFSKEYNFCDVKYIRNNSYLNCGGRFGRWKWRMKMIIVVNIYFVMIILHFNLPLQFIYELFHIYFTSFHSSRKDMNSINKPQLQSVAS